MFPASRTLSLSKSIFALTALLSSTAISQESFRLEASDGAPEDQFGRAVAVSGDVAIVGAHLADKSGYDSGAAYLFDVHTGEELLELSPEDAHAGDEFGVSVSISGELALVGAHYAENSQGHEAGCAYLFDVESGAQLLKLTPSDQDAGDAFGRSVAIHGDVAIVGAFSDNQGGQDAGAAYLFDVHSGAQLFKLMASDAASFDSFGVSVAISGDVAIVGADWDDDNGASSGSAYLFDVQTGAELSKLTASDGAPSAYFGHSVAIDGGRALVGANRQDGVTWDSGAAYLFDVVTGQETATLIPSDAAASDLFGWSVALSGDNAVISACLADHLGSNSGAVYLFDAETGAELEELIPSDGGAYDSFGSSVDADQGLIVIGANFAEVQGERSGAAYLFGSSSAGPGQAFCFGDELMTSCPCGNAGGAGEGCANDTGAGAVLSASGSASVAAADLVLSASQLTPGPGLFFQGDHAVQGGAGVAFGDGLRCAGGGVVRLEVGFANAANQFSVSSTNDIAAKGGATAGETKLYQFWYRDSGGSPCGTGFNLSNGYEVIWSL